VKDWGFGWIGGTDTGKGGRSVLESLRCLLFLGWGKRICSTNKFSAVLNVQQLCFFAPPRRSRILAPQNLRSNIQRAKCMRKRFITASFAVQSVPGRKWYLKSCRSVLLTPGRTFHSGVGQVKLLQLLGDYEHISTHLKSVPRPPRALSRARSPLDTNSSTRW
jgi:hypothetical protein